MYSIILLCWLLLLLSLNYCTLRINACKQLLMVIRGFVTLISCGTKIEFFFENSFSQKNSLKLVTCEAENEYPATESAQTEIKQLKNKKTRLFAACAQLEVRSSTQLLLRQHTQLNATQTQAHRLRNFRMQKCSESKMQLTATTNNRLLNLFSPE